MSNGLWAAGFNSFVVAAELVLWSLGAHLDPVVGFVCAGVWLVLGVLYSVAAFKHRNETV